MLSEEVVLEVRRLLDAGQLSQRKIAVRLKVSRGTVHAIANGRRALHGRETRTLQGQRLGGRAAGGLAAPLPRLRGPGLDALSTVPRTAVS